MTADRRIPVSTTPGAVTGDSFMDAVQEEISKLYDISITKLATVAGTNTITATYDPPLTGSLVDGMRFELAPAATTTSATVTLNGKTVVDRDGNAPTAGSLKLGSKYLLTYDLSADKFYCLTYLPPLAFVDRPSWRNILIDNGGLELWQRGAGDTAAIAIAASTTAYGPDRWYMTTSANQACLMSAEPPLSNRSRIAGRFQRNSGQTGTGALVLAYPLTKEECVRLRGSKVSLSFLARAGANFSPTSGTLTYNLYFGTSSEGKRGAGFVSESNPISSTVNLTANGSSISTVTATSSANVGTTVTQGELRFTWTPTGTASTNDWVELDDVQVELAVAPTEFEYAPFAFMLQQCQRYYAKTFPYGTAPAQAAGISNAICAKDDSQPWQNFLVSNGGVVSGLTSMQMVGFAVNWHFPVRMRTSPSITTYNPISAASSWREPTGNSGSAVDITASVNPNSNGGDTIVTIAADGGARNANIGALTETLAYIHATADASL